MRRRRFAAVLVELAGEVEHQALGVDAVLEHLCREIAVAHAEGRGVGHVEPELAFAQADQSLQRRGDVLARRVPWRVSSPAGPGPRGGHVPDVAGDHASAGEDDPGLPLAGHHRQVAGLLGVCDDLQDLEERKVLDRARRDSRLVHRAHRRVAQMGQGRGLGDHLVSAGLEAPRSGPSHPRRR